MPTFTLISDYHVDQWKDKGAAFYKAISSTNLNQVDACLVAGDIAEYGAVFDELLYLCDIFPMVIYTPGNHDYCHIGTEKMQNDLMELSAKTSNLEVLIRRTINVQGVRIAGATMWYPQTMFVQANKSRFYDFRHIRKANDFIPSEWEKDSQFLINEKADLFLTHHIPDPKGIAPQWENHPWNDFFCSNLFHKVNHFPKYWCYGHTHQPMRYMIEDTTFVCNPYGSPGESQKDFKPDLRIKIDVA